MEEIKAFPRFSFIDKNAQGTKEYRYEQSGMIFVLIPDGEFIMGNDEELRTKDEKPAHKVVIKEFLIAKYPTTQDVWQKIMGSNPSKFKKGGNYPVDTVSWDNCQEFCQKTGLRLPTEAEWEFAFRSWTTTRYFWGEHEDMEYMWFQRNAEKSTHPVGQKKPNNFGLYDMAGNVWEWCQDWYGPYSATSQINPGGPETGEQKVMRGGSWFSFHYNCTATNRFGAKPSKLLNLNGFRCAF